jgi:hypothetical protein
MRRNKSKKYRSGFEETVINDLEANDVGFRYEPEYLVYVEPATTRKYLPDLWLDNGVIVEVKGRWTLHDRKKMVLVIEQNPKLDIRMLFQRDHKINKGSKTKYTDWCKKRGIKCAVGTAVPKSWLKGAKK